MCHTPRRQSSRVAQYQRVPVLLLTRTVNNVACFTGCISPGVCTAAHLRPEPARASPHAALTASHHAASSMGIPIHRKPDGPPARDAGAAAQRGSTFREHERRMRTDAEAWKRWAFPISDADRERVRAADKATRETRLARSRVSASYGVLEFAQRTDAWLTKCSRYNKARPALSRLARMCPPLVPSGAPLVSSLPLFRAPLRR